LKNLTKIEWTEEAIRDVEKLDKTIAQRVLRKLTWLSKNFQAIIPEPLSGGFKGAYKLRVGN